jgi:hypothetical protein
VDPAAPPRLHPFSKDARARREAGCEKMVWKANQRIDRRRSKLHWRFRQSSEATVVPGAKAEAVECKRCKRPDAKLNPAS